MAIPNDRAPSDDPRWGGHVPWSLRYNVSSEKGDFDNFFSLLRARLYDLFYFNEASIPSVSHFGARIATESLGRFPYNSENGLPNQILQYFTYIEFAELALRRTAQDPEEQDARNLEHALGSAEQVKAKALAISTRQTRNYEHLNRLIAERLEVLQSILLLLSKSKQNNVLPGLVRDIQRFAADSNVFLTIDGNPPTVMPIEEPLLQREVIDRLLPRLQAKYPDRATDLIGAYHDLLKGTDTNTIFGNAFKSLEQLAREISGVKIELSNRQALEKHFPKLHTTIRDTIIKLAGHRGDEGAHGRKGPDEYEIRYLLFSICNVSLLLLDYKEHCG